VLPLRAEPSGLDGIGGLSLHPATNWQGFVTTPGGVKVEIIEDKSLKVPIGFDHTHFIVEASRMKEMRFLRQNVGANP